MSESIGSGHYYEMTLNDKKVGFCSIARFPHPKVKDIMTIGRIVIIPEFQGFGVGIKFMNEICELYKTDRIRITTSLKPFMIAMSNNKKWKCVRSGRVSGSVISTSIFKKTSQDRITATFQYVRN